MRRHALTSTLLLALIASHGRAQSSVRTAIPNDSLFRHARRQVSEGNGAAGRALVDSLLKRETEGTTAYGDALFWRGALAETASEAERDYRRVIVEYPLSFYSDDALLAIAELEQARGDRAGALQHMLRFVREHPVSAARGNAAFAAARLAFEQRDTRTGCAMITEARGSSSPADVELRNQIDYFGTRCTSVALAADAAASTQASVAATSPVRDSTPTPATPLKKAATNAATRTTTPPVTPSASVAAKPAAVKAPAEKSPERVPEKAPIPTTIARVAVVTPPSAPAPVATPTPASTANVRGNYTIQLAAYNTQAEAEQLG